MRAVDHRENFGDRLVKLARDCLAHLAHREQQPRHRFVFDGGDAVLSSDRLDALSEAMRVALQSKSSKLDEMGDAGHERVRQRHRTSTEVDKLETLLTAVAGKTGGR